MASKVKCRRCKRVRKLHQVRDIGFDPKWFVQRAEHVYECQDRDACYEAMMPKLEKRDRRLDRNHPAEDTCDDFPDPSIDLASLLWEDDE